MVNNNNVDLSVPLKMSLFGCIGYYGGNVIELFGIKKTRTQIIIGVLLSGMNGSLISRSRTRH
jgi:hypothetical protein